MTETLEKYHAREKEIERIPLNLKSYEIQIKELTDEINRMRIS